IAGRRGWPLTALLTPEGQVFAGGTYFPPDDDPASGRPGPRTVLQQVVRAWRDDRVRMRRQAQALEDALRKANEDGTTEAAPGGNSHGLPEPTSPAAPKDLLQRLAPVLQGALDAKAGGFVFGVVPLSADSGAGGDVPKFPTPRALDLCLAQYVRSGDTGSLAVVTATLDGMLRGGIYDHLAGGFHRCCADRWWRLPRFEKLLIPNAELAAACLHAWQVTGNTRYKRAVEDTLACWTTLQDPSGTFFYGSQAGGTSDLDDNDYFTWTIKEFEGVLRDDADCRLARAFYDVHEAGDLPATAPQRNVLFEALTLEDAAQRAGVPPGVAEKRLRRSREQLLLARSRRPAPVLDRNVYVDGNALMAAAFIESGRALGQPAHVERGVKTLRGLLKEAFPAPAESHERDVRGTTGVPPVAESNAVHLLRSGDMNGIPPEFRIVSPDFALAQDEAALLYACALAFEATQQKEFADAAEAGLRRLQQSFWDKERGGYDDRVAPASKLLSGGNWRVKIWQDTEEPAANGLVALACVRLGAATGRKEFTDRAASIVAAFGPTLEKSGPYGATLSCAADGVQYGPVQMQAKTKPETRNPEP
ncbi:MAG: DUF255 domain-containing protein, partial [Planctomycetota bacterium]|nr:DUF255 domain-containing protein [Planctomycetota bacterium]